MTNEDELKKAYRYYWTGGFWCCAALYTSAIIMVLVIWMVVGWVI